MWQCKDRSPDSQCAKHWSQTCQYDLFDILGSAPTHPVSLSYDHLFKNQWLNRPPLEFRSIGGAPYFGWDLHHTMKYELPTCSSSKIINHVRSSPPFGLSRCWLERPAHAAPATHQVWTTHVFPFGRGRIHQSHDNPLPIVAEFLALSASPIVNATSYLYRWRHVSVGTS